MQQFRVILHGLDVPHEPGPCQPSGSSRGRGALRDFRHNREFRAYFAEPQGLPARPPTVSLLGESSRSAPAAASNGFELGFFAPEPEGWTRRVGNGVSRLAFLVMAATVLTPRSAQAAPGVQAAPHPRLDPAVPVRDGPPVQMLSPEERRLARGLPPLLDGSGKPARLAAYHTNTSPYHANTPGVVTHTNAWHNHANVITPHSNNWMNHSNIAPGTIPHTNVVPGDFIF